MHAARPVVVEAEAKLFPGGLCVVIKTKFNNLTRVTFGVNNEHTLFMQARGSLFYSGWIRNVDDCCVPGDIYKEEDPMCAMDLDSEREAEGS